MNTPALSVVIPTHKRADVLRLCLEHLMRQTIADRLEIIVVSDGHDPATANMMDALTPPATSALPRDRVHFIEISKAQQGVARNRGMYHATGSITLFIGDDALLAPDACEQHLRAHEKHDKPVAVLGFTTWDPAVGITPVMRWLEKTGWQFGYPMLEPYRHAVLPRDLQHRFTYTINISLPTTIATAFPFREDVSLYGWEDILWGVQLRDAGIPLYYEPDAMALHHHHITPANSLKRMYTLGASLAHITRIAPELDRRPTGLKLVAYHIIALLPTMRGRHYRSLLRGLRAGDAVKSA